MQAFLMLIGKYGIFQDYVIQPNKKAEADLGIKCWINSGINHFVLMPLVGYLMYPLLFPYIMIPTEMFPSGMTVFYQLLGCVFIEDFLFYWSHRALHTPFLYKRFHKKHHEFKVLTGYSIASEYTHPVESLLGNILPLMLGPILLSVHLSTMTLWVVLRMLKTCDAHSGYKFAWSPFGIVPPLNPAVRHDFHHEKGLGSYGSFFLIWDTLCGTDADYLAYANKKKA
jgi:sterol desaturase/sphingolipid hydroxylase (fatty acid hydroxylase superfamily)